MKVFWPTTGVKRDTGEVLGWRVEDTLCVVGIVDEWLSQRICTRNDDNTQLALCDPHGHLLQVLARARALNVGIQNGNEPKGQSEPTFWLENGLPISSSLQVDIVLYTPPDHTRLRFLTLRPSSQRIDANAEGQAELAKQASYSSRRQRDGSDHGGMEDVIPFLNDVKRVQMNLGDLATLEDMTPSTVTPTSSTPRDPPTPAKRTNAVMIVSLVQFALIPLTTLSSLLISVISYSPHPSIGNAKDHSALLRQLFVRTEQLNQGPGRFLASREDVEITLRSARYMQFWNTVWLVINDLILGYCARQVIMQCTSYLKSMIAPAFKYYTVDLIILVLRWLNDWPVGLKLNTPLSQFFCTSFSLIISHWGDVLTPLLDRTSSNLILCLSTISLCGLTFLLAAMHDLINILNYHLAFCDGIMKRIFRWQSGSLGALWNLFRGKRWNVLRQRTDSYAYDVDQLFLGTLLFTVSAFLFPTVLTYAALFALTRLIVSLTCRIIQIAITALNSFPLFELMFRLKEPSRLPAGIYFQVRNLKTRVDATGSGLGIPIAHVLELKTTPKSLSDSLRSSITLT